MFTGGLKFKKVELKDSFPTRGKGLITITAHDRKMTIPSRFGREMGLEHGTRVDLLQSGITFAFKIEPVGLVRVNKPAPESHYCVINNAGLCNHILAATKARQFDAWVSDGMLFFKPSTDGKAKR